MPESTLSWVLFVAYCVTIAGLSWSKRRQSGSMSSFAVGGRQVSPVLVGLSLAANMTSVATFVINPGLVHAYGLAGVIGYGLAAPAGIFVGLIVTSKRFRRVGDRFTVLTVPQWIGSAYGDDRLTLAFAVFSLLQVSFLVLIVAAIVLVLMKVLGLSMVVALVLVVAFTFAYIALGGAALHIWSNALQAMTMIAVALLLVGSGAALFAGGLGGFLERLATVGPHYAGLTNPDSLLFRDLFEVVVANFIIGLAIIMQPHIISKSLYLRSERDVNRYLVTAMIAGTLFTAVLVVGLYARLTLGGEIAPDHVVASYIATTFSPALRAVVMLGVLAAGFSTLEGIILALASIVANDFFGTLARRRGLGGEALERRLLAIGRGFLVVLAPVTFALAWWQIASPSLSVAIFAQNGIYGLFAATFAPVLFGLFLKRPLPAAIAGLAAGVALVVHFGMYYFHVTQYHTNPAVPATCALISSTAVMAVALVVRRLRQT